MDFNELGLSHQLLTAIKEMGFAVPTPIQEKAIPFLLESKGDLIALAATGTGKTAAFGLPLLQNLKLKDSVISALILCPTRELCRQITKELMDFSKYMAHIDVVAVYGGAPIGPQIQKIKRGAQVVVATPGRIKDLQNRGVADLSHIKLLVLDEADEMLNMGFEEDLTEILSHTPNSKQIALFSATLSSRIGQIAKGYLKDPYEISVGEKNKTVDTVEHRYHLVYHTQRYIALRRILDFNSEFYGIIFCKTKQSTADITAALILDGYKAEALHGDIAQQQRDTVMQRFRDGLISILVATDVAARGIDVDNLTHVVHYELPEDPEAYIHRSGRTGRANKKGVSIAIVSPTEKKRLLFIQKLSKTPIALHPLPSVKEIFSRRLESFASSLLEESYYELKKWLVDYEERFKNITREQLLERLLNFEFGSLISYYQNCEEIRVVAGENEKNKNLSQQDKRKFSSKIKSSPRRSSCFSGYRKIVVSLGKKDGINPKDVMGYINKTTLNRSISIGSIKIYSDHSIVEIEEEYIDLVLAKANNKKFDSKTVYVKLYTVKGKNSVKKKKGKS